MASGKTPPGVLAMRSSHQLHETANSRGFKDGDGYDFGVRLPSLGTYWRGSLARPDRLEELISSLFSCRRVAKSG